MNSFDEAKNFVRHSKEMLPQLEAAYEISLHNQKIERNLRINIKNLMENLRSALDYSAHGLFDKYGSSSNANPNIYFPYALATQTLSEFRAKDRIEKSIPGISSSRADIVAVLESYQHFSGSNNQWVPVFMELNNKNKHQQLTPQIIHEHRGIKLTTGNSTLTAAGIDVMPGGKFVVNGKEIAPGEYNADNLPVIDPPAEVTGTRWESFYFSSNNEEVLPFLRRAIEGVESIVNALSVL